MGCTASSEHPSIYNERVGKKKEPNGPGIVPTTPKNPNAGDYSQYQLAKHNRARNQKSHQNQTMMAADQMAERLIEERELLSLGARSRGTSRNTSRTTSPNGNRRNPHAKTTKEEPAPMTPVAELTRGESLKRLDDHNLEGVQNEQTNSQKKIKRHKTKEKTKKHKKRKGVKSKKSKTKLLEKGSDDSGMDENENICDEVDDVEDSDNDVNNHVTFAVNDSEKCKLDKKSVSRSSQLDGDTSVLTEGHIDVRADSISVHQRDSAIAEIKVANQNEAESDQASADVKL